ncbi:TetR/AcrR family transcriptional regulator [Azospirillum picis]|uniref:AcrR family transcriptional regulator n=1 Tax=Azospirillum picis TaxID=488438 RepID=A0ABU0MM15_9PROT|nr:TetR/AcrR family transcriptional regulator [Azospirillum picis]MBP2300531.1 AcrR family transcriptional regulator [Azospirillum picis]MDQ0534500.1 AcrR family transcriptional regulator [Azospirillum picis]
MNGLQGFQKRFDLSMEALCARILDRHAATIRVKKPAVAIANLARIVETTLTLANRKGFHSMSLRDLAEQSGLSMGALYAYFDGKDTLLMMILGQVVGAVDEVLAHPPDALAEDPAGRLRWLLETHLYLTETMHPWFVFAYMEAKAFPRDGRELAVASEMKTESLIADTLADGARRGLFTLPGASGDVAMAAALIKPMLQDWYVKRAKHRRRGITPEDYARSLIAFVEAAVGAAAPVTGGRACSTGQADPGHPVAGG